MHPLEFITSGLIPSFSGLILLGDQVHLFTIMVWGFIRLIESVDGHSGYEFPWLIFRLLPFGCDATYHNFHHTKNVGNFSFL